MNNYIWNDDVQKFIEYLPIIKENWNIRMNKLLEPTYDEFMTVLEVILEYIKKNKKIIYGGYALKLYMENIKNNEIKIYKNFEKFDIEFYWYDPIQDVKDLCNLLHKNGFKYVWGQEADHEETYWIFVNFLKKISTD